ncbi:MAG: hypothetical protein ACK4WH_08620 [Phycisphaerales bacterium]
MPHPLLRRVQTSVSAQSGLLVCAGAVMLGAAQPRPAPPTFTPVDPGVVDMASNAASLRIIQIDQRIPTGFDQVYQVSPSSALGARGERPIFARKSGALTALFPRADYKRVGGGLLAPVIPPGTRFVIGESGFAPSPAPTHVSSSAVDRRSINSARRAADSSARPAAAEPPAARNPLPESSPAEPEGMLTDERYRVRRVRELLDLAAGVSSESATANP